MTPGVRIGASFWLLTIKVELKEVVWFTKTSFSKFVDSRILCVELSLEMPVIKATASLTRSILFRRVSLF